jgi:asparagine synthase (glutamine-hydrolysing)
MCGIVGLWHRRVTGDEPALLARASAVLRHRGPDDDRSWFSAEAGVGFAFRRLAILDLTPTGAQPMGNDDGSVHIVHNGEVYNFTELRERLRGRYQLRSSGDTEVVLRLYEDKGVDCTTELEGMFAFAVYDAARRRLLLARDRAGIKPLYYASAPGRFAFASEPKALLTLPWVSRVVDPVAVGQYLAVGYVPAPRTIFTGVRQLPPAHRLVLEDGEARVERYWSLRPGPDTTRRTEQDWADGLDEVLRRAVGRQMVSDVPLGAFLSGGLDSSLVVALMHEIGTSVRTFSIGFEGMGAYDERPWARRVAQRFGSRHEEFVVAPRAADDLPEMLRHFDQPFADSSAIPLYYLARLTRRHVTVALSGTGGDELFGGYRRYAAARLAGVARRLPRWTMQAARAVADRVPASRRSRAGEALLLLRRFSRTVGLPPDDEYRRLMTVADVGLLRTPPAGEDVDVVGAALRASPVQDVITRRQFADFQTYLPDDLLVKEDRMTMAAGLEARVPLLDDEVVAFAARLPADLKVRRLTTKYLLKHVAGRYLPRDVVHRPKHGFAVPVSEWLRGPLHALAADMLLPQGSGWFERGAVEQLWNEHQAGADHGAALYALMVFELWHRSQRSAA